jgi:hypothetical protein
VAHLHETIDEKQGKKARRAHAGGRAQHHELAAPNGCVGPTELLAPNGVFCNLEHLASASLRLHAEFLQAISCTRIHPTSCWMLKRS